MPRKTKKEKIIARYRRKLNQIAQLAPRDETTIKQSHSSAIIPQKTEEIVPAAPTAYETKLKNWTIKDLQKTIVITGLILALEFFVFYANLKGILFKR